MPNALFTAISATSPQPVPTFNFYHPCALSCLYWVHHLVAACANHVQVVQNCTSCELCKVWCDVLRDPEGQSQDRIDLSFMISYKFPIEC